MTLTEFFLGLIALCLLIMTIVLVSMVRDVRGTLKRANALLRSWDRTVVRSQRVMHRVEAIVLRACDAASDVLESATSWGHRARSYFVKQFGNGARSEPRRHVKRV